MANGPIPTPLKPQQTRVVGGVANVVKENATMLIKSGDGSLWVQNGVVFDDGGKPLSAKDIPPWFWAEYKKTSQAMKDAHGELHEPAEGAALVKPSSAFPSRDPAPIPNVEDDPLVDLGELNKPQVILTADEVRSLNEQSQVGQDRGSVVVRGTQGPDPTADREANGPKGFGKPVTIRGGGQVEHPTPDPSQERGVAVGEPNGPNTPDTTGDDRSGEKADLMAMTKADLIDLAKDEGVSLGGSETKEAIADKIMAERS